MVCVQNFNSVPTTKTQFKATFENHDFTRVYKF